MTKQDRWSVNLKLLEQGDIYFFYKPKRGVEHVSSLEDVSRFYLVLEPQDKERRRFLVLGPKQMPQSGPKQDRAWGFIEKVGGRGFAVLPENEQLSLRKGQARPAGEGLYALVKHHIHTHLVYALELPTRLGEVQRGLNLYRQANFIIVVRGSQTSVAERYVPADPPELLNQEGASFLLLSVDEPITSFGLNVRTDKETEDTADIFSKLKLNKKRHPIASLIRGEWQ